MTIVMSFFFLGFIKSSLASSLDWQNGRYEANYYKQPASTNVTGVATIWHATTTSFLNFYEALACKQTTSEDHLMYARVRNHDTGLWLATSTYSIDSDDIGEVAYNADISVMPGNCYSTGKGIQTFIFNPAVQLNSGTEYAVNIYTYAMDGNLGNRDYVFVDSSATDYTDIWETYGTGVGTRHTDMSPYYQMGFSRYYTIASSTTVSNGNETKYCNAVNECITTGNGGGNCGPAMSCMQTYSYTENTIGGYLSIYEDEASTTYTIENPLLRTSIVDRPIHYSSFVMDYPEEATSSMPFSVDYCLYYESPTSYEYDMIICDITWTYVWTPSGAIYFDPEGNAWTTPYSKVNEFCNCNDLATSTDPGFFSDLASSIQCAALRVACYLAFPGDTGWQYFGLAVDNMKQGFPLDILENVKSNIQEATTSAATTTHVIAIAPLKWWDANTHTYKETGANLLDNHTFESGMGATLYAFYYKWFRYLIWGLCFSYILYRLFHIKFWVSRDIPMSEREDIRLYNRQRKIAWRENQLMNKHTSGENAWLKSLRK